MGWTRALPFLAAGGLVLGLQPPAAVGAPDGLSEQVGRLRREARSLERQLELASGEGFYLLVDPSGRAMRLMLGGAVLQEYDLLRVDVGRPRVLFLVRRLPESWWEEAWEGGRIVPPRRRDRFRLRVPGGGETADAPQIPVPPPPDAFPAPGRYRIRYQGGVSLEVRSDGGGSSGALRFWLDDLAGAVSGDRLRLRVLLSPEDAEALYRALPPDTRLMVLPPSS